MKYIYIYFSSTVPEKIFVCLFVPTQRCKYRGGGSVNHSQGAIFPNFSGKIRLVDYRRGEAWRRPVIVSTASNPRSSPLSLSFSLKLKPRLRPGSFSPSKRESNAGGSLPADAAIATSPPVLLLFLSRFLARGCLAVGKKSRHW